MSDTDPYVYPGTDVLKNAFNERDKGALNRKELAVTSTAIDELQTNPVRGNFDGAHLKAIHGRIFSGVYPGFAGQNRTIELTKPEIALRGRSVEYGAAKDLDATLDRESQALSRFRWDDSNRASSARQFGERMTGFWKAHPFREGNSRAILVFMTQYAKEKGFKLDHEVLSRYPSETRDAFAKAAAGEPRELGKLIHEARNAEISRQHPIIGRMTSEAAEVLKLMNYPKVSRAEPGEQVRGQVLTTSYRAVLVMDGTGVRAVDAANFDRTPANDARVSLTVTTPFDSARRASIPYQDSAEPQTRTTDEESQSLPTAQAASAKRDVDKPRSPADAFRDEANAFAKAFREGTMTRSAAEQGFDRLVAQHRGVLKQLGNGEADRSFAVTSTKWLSNLQQQIDKALPVPTRATPAGQDVADKPSPKRSSPETERYRGR
jgi:fido (protein-threonine AMPylation protein)